MRLEMAGLIAALLLSLCLMSGKGGPDRIATLQERRVFMLTAAIFRIVMGMLKQITTNFNNGSLEARHARPN